MGAVLKQVLEANGIKNLFVGITAGQVVDTNDPHQMGRIRVLCKGLGDDENMLVTNIPWAVYASPFGGTDAHATRGREDSKTTGPVAYGMWNIPKVGATVLVGCIDGDPSQRFWFASLYPQYLTHTLPHGRFIGNEGPLSSKESPIEPLSSNLKKAFVDPSSSQWQSRAIDKQVAGVEGEVLGKQGQSDISKRADAANQGYAKSRVEPDLVNELTGGIHKDPQTYAWVTPGFHAISMDDRKDNCRVRIRTTAGHQILMDDTNERIYINTAQGNSWIEIDEKGFIDVYAGKDLALHAVENIHIKADKNVFIDAGETINLTSGVATRISAVGNIDVKTNGNLFLDAQGEFNILAQGEGKITTTGILNLRSVANIHQTGQEIHLNGPDATGASPATPATQPDRVPAHEPWDRPGTYASGRNPLWKP